MEELLPFDCLNFNDFPSSAIMELYRSFIRLSSAIEELLPFDCLKFQ